MTLHHDLPPAEQLRARLYRGDLFLLSATDASRTLASEARALLAGAVGGDPRTAHERLSNDELFEKIGAIRRTLFLDPHFHQRVREVLASLGLDPQAHAFDPIRLRVVVHRGHENPLARAVYYPHRDTWYAHPQAVVAHWIPLDDLAPEETFVFYPERFQEPVANDSERFDYGSWVKDGWGRKIGWQNKRDGLDAHYPATLDAPDAGPAVGFSCRHGDNLLFAGAHYHRTLPQSLGRTRYSLDFRFVHLDEMTRGLGAPNVDSRCTGSAVVDYVRTPAASPSAP